jgi:hypothetical protein
MSQMLTTRRAGAGAAIGALVASALLFAPSAQAATTTDVRESQIAATAEPYAGYHHEGTGTFRVVNAGLELAGDSAFVRGYTNNTVDQAHPLDGSQTNVADLATLGDSVVTATGDPTLVVSVYSDQVATTDQLTLLSPQAAPGGQWVSSVDIGSTVKGGQPAPLADLVAAIGSKYRVKGFGLYNDGDTAVVSSLTFAGVTYQFKNNAPVAAARTVSTKVNTPVSIPLTATDVDGNALTYAIDSVVGGSVTGSGATQTYTPARNFKGAGSVTYTVTDGRGGSVTSTLTVKVDKLKGKVTVYRIHPSRPSVRSTVYVYAAVQVDGKPAPARSTVYAYVKGKKVMTAKVNSSGKVKIKLPSKLPAGKATLKITQPGSSILNGDSDSVAVRVRK